jgi:two-component system, LytTR family, sensor kinase
MYTNPILKNFRNFLVYLLCWFILVLLNFSLLFFSTEVGIKISIFDSIIYTLVLAGLGLSLWYPARYIHPEKTTTSKLIGTHLIGAIITSIIWLSIGYYLMNTFLTFTVKYENFIYNTLPWRFFIGILFYALVTSFYYMIIYYTGFQERVIKESELKNLVTEAELRSLKFQINPHFIFNSLNSMSALTEIDPKRARSMILKLAEFLRFILATNEKEKNSLKEELKNIKLYLEIERVRFEDKFEYVEEIEDQCWSMEIPSMILQPLFENAIKHAVYETLDVVTLSLKAKAENNYLGLVLENNYDESSPPRKGTGVGLRNIEERLQLIYREAKLMEVNKGNGIFRVSLFIPL